MSIKKINLQKIFVINFVFVMLNGAFFNIVSGVSGGIGWYTITTISTVSFILSDKQYRELKINLNLLWFSIFACMYILMVYNAPTNTYTSIIGINFKTEIIFMIQNFLVLIVCVGISKNFIYDKMINKTFWFILLINALFTLKALNADPSISKYLATPDPSLYTAVSTFGVVGYNYVYAIIFIVPILLPFFSEVKNKKIKCTILLLIISMVLFVFKLGYFIAIVLLLSMVLFYFTFKADVRFKIIFIIPLSTIVLTLFNPSSFANIIYIVSNKINIFTISQRLDQIAYFIETGQRGESLARLDLYMDSINSFIQHPIVGNALLEESYNVSGHSEILDILAHGGLILAIPFSLFLYFSFKSTLKYVKTNKQRIAVITVFIFYIVLNFINTSFSSLAIMLVIIAGLPVGLRIGNQLREREI